MKPLKTLMLTAALALLAAPTVHAAQKVMASAPAYRLTNGEIYCDILNLNPIPETVNIEILGYAGNIVLSSGPVTLPPNTGTFLGDTSSNSGAWCKFTVDGSPKKYRATAIYDNPSPGMYTSAIPAL